MLLIGHRLDSVRGPGPKLATARSRGVDMTTIMVLDTLVLMAGTYFSLADGFECCHGTWRLHHDCQASMIAYIPQDIWNSIQELKISSLWLALMVFSLVFLIWLLR